MLHLLLWTTVVPCCASAANLTTSAASTAIGEYIAAGLGAPASASTSLSPPSNTSLSRTLTIQSTLTLTKDITLTSTRHSWSNTSYAQSSTSSADPIHATGTSAISNTTDLSSAEACLRSWSLYYINQATYSSELVTTSNRSLVQLTNTATQTGIPICEGVTSLTTLCDGHPRVVGTATCRSDGTDTVTATVSTQALQEFVTGPPGSSQYPLCTVNTDECRAIGSSNTALVTISSLKQQLCQSTVAAPPSYSTNSAGGSCDKCLLSVSEAQLLYWPVRTVPALSDDLCNTGPVKVIGGTPTGNGPNTIITAGVTITSPSVAMALTGLARLDNCGSTVRNTVIPMAAEDVSSVRGGRILVNPYPFDYQDLNYRCQSSNSSNYTIQDFPGDSCYQEVPADAYFNAHVAWDDWVNIYNYQFTTGSQWTSMTIGNDYHPQLNIPKEWTSWANSIFNTSSCLIFPGGAWDPPHPLTAVNSEASAALPSTHATATTLSTTISASPIPAQSITTVPAQTSTAAGTSPLAIGTSNPSSASSQGTTSAKSTSDSDAAPSASAYPSTTASIDPSSRGSTSIGNVASPASGDPATTINNPTPTSVVSADPESPQPSSTSGDPGASSTSSCGVACILASLLPQGTTASASEAVAASTGPYSIGVGTVVTGSYQTSASVADTGNTLVSSTTVLVSEQSAATGDSAASGDNSGDPGTVPQGSTTNALSVLSAAQSSAAQTSDLSSTQALVSGVVVSVGSESTTIVEVGSGTYIVGSTTLTQGQTARLSDGQTISAGSQGISVGDATVIASVVSTLTGSAPVDPTTVIEASATDSQTTVIASLIAGQTDVATIDGTTLSIGGAPVTLSDSRTLSAASNGIIDGTQTFAFHTIANADPSTVVVASIANSLTTFTASSIAGESGVAVVGGTTLSIGGPALTASNGPTLSVASDGIVDGTQTFAFSTTAISESSTTYLGGGSSQAAALADGLTALQVQGDSSAAVVEGKTLTVGGSAVTLSNGATVSLATSGIVQGGTTTVPFLPLATATSVVAVLAGSVTALAAQSDAQTAVVEGETLTVGGSAITLSNSVTVSLASGGIVENGATTVAFSAASSVAATSVVAVLASDLTAVGAQSGSGTAVIEGQTLTVGGPAATLSDTLTVSLASGGIVENGTKTLPFSTVAIATAAGGSTNLDPSITTTPSSATSATAGTAGGRSSGVAASTTSTGDASALRNVVFSGARSWTLLYTVLLAYVIMC